MNNIVQDILGNRVKTIIALVIIIFVVLISVSIGSGNAYTGTIVVMMFIYAIAATAWNLIGGYAGQLSLGHASFFGIGAYSVVLMNVKLNVSPWVGLLVGVGLAILAALIIGLPCFRLRGPFFALATIAVGEVLRVLAINLPDLTYGSVGISIPMTFSFGNMLFHGKVPYIILTGVFLIIILLITHKMENSKIGYYLVAIREDQDAAASLGVSAMKAKLTSFVISAAFTAIAGVLFAQFILYIDPVSVFASNISLQLVLMSVVGGLGTKFGPMLGAFIVVPLSQYIRAYFGGSIHGLDLLIYAIVLIVVIMIIPRGIIPTLTDAIKRNEGQRLVRKVESEV